jgi:hypothetical protein
VVGAAVDPEGVKSGFVFESRGGAQPLTINNINTSTLLHFQKHSPTLKIPAMRTSFTGRITTTLGVNSNDVVVVIIGVVVTVPV